MAVDFDTLFNNDQVINSWLAMKLQRALIAFLKAKRLQYYPLIMREKQDKKGVQQDNLGATR